MFHERQIAWIWANGGVALWCLLGCNTTAPPLAEPDALGSAVTPLQLLVISDPDLAAGIGKQWTARSETPLAIRETTEAELLADLQHGRLSLENVDAIIYPSALLGTLVTAEQLAIMPERLFQRSQYAPEEVFPLVQGTAVRWGQQRFAVPLGMPVVMLAYRSDLLPAGTKLPTSWEEWGDFTRTWHSSALGQGGAPPSVRPVVQTLSEGHAAVVFLARAAATVRHRSQYSTLFDPDSMQSRIDNPGFVKALQQLVADCEASGGPQLLSPDEAFDELVAGRAAMVIGRPLFRMPTSEARPQRRTESLPESVRFASLPGARAMYSDAEDRWDDRRVDESLEVPLLGVAGRLGSVLQSSRRRRAAWNLLLLLSGPQWGADIAASSPETAPFRRSHQDRTSDWMGPGWSSATVDSWYAALASNLGAHDWLQLPRIPGYHDYLSVLDQAVREAVEGQQSPQESLSWAAGKWSELTESLGMESQRIAYRRSIGLDP